MAREQGYVAKSRDLAAAVLLTAGVGVVLLTGEGIAKFFGQLAAQRLGEQPALSLDADDAVNQLREVVGSLAGVLLAPLLLILAAAIVSHLGQTGLLLQPQRLAPDLNRINPLHGFARIFSVSGLAGTAQALVKITVIVGVCSFCLWSKRAAIVGLASLSTAQLALFLCDFLLWTTLKTAGALVLAGLLDYAFQRSRYEASLRMTPQEVKEEMRQLQVDPQVAARRKRLLRRRAAKPSQQVD